MRKQFVVKSFMSLYYYLSSNQQAEIEKLFMVSFKWYCKLVVLPLYLIILEQILQ